MLKRGGRARGFIAVGATVALIRTGVGVSISRSEYIDGSLISLSPAASASGCGTRTTT